MTPESALAGLRFVHFTAAMLIWGAGAYLLALVPAVLAQRVMSRLGPVLAGAALLLLATGLLRLPVIAAGYGDGWGDGFRPEVLGAILRTGAGTAWLIEAVIAVLLVGAQLLPRGRWAASMALAGGMLASSALSGHAAMAMGLLRVAHQLNDATHLLAAGFWLGALLPLTLILRQEAGGGAITAVRRFAVAAQFAVALALVTGIANALLVKGGMPASWSSDYDHALLAKIGIVAAMLCLAAVNHVRFLPRLAAGSAGAARALRRGALAEIALGLGAVGLVSVLGLWDPA